MKKKLKYICILLLLVLSLCFIYFTIQNKFNNWINIYVATFSGDKNSPLKTIEATKKMVDNLLKDEKSYTT